jgi:hypothetical protein
MRALRALLALLVLAGIGGAAHAAAPDFTQDPFAEAAPDPFNGTDNATFEKAVDAANTASGADLPGGSPEPAAPSGPSAPSSPPPSPPEKRAPGLELPLLAGAVVLVALAARRR